MRDYDEWYSLYKKNSKTEYEELIQNDILKYKDEIKFFNREFIYVILLLNNYLII